MKRVLNIIPVPVPPESLDAFASQLSGDFVHPDFENVFVSARAGGGTLDSAYETTLADAFVLDAGCRAEEQGYAAVCVNSMSDSALAALRSRLTIPVVAPSPGHHAARMPTGQAFLGSDDVARVARALSQGGPRERAHRTPGVGAYIGVRPDAAELLAGKEEFVFAAVEREARAAVEEDGADVIILGSTTMHQSHAYLSSVLDVPVLNPGVVAYKLCELLVQTGLAHSKRAYPSPERLQDDLLSAVASVFPSKD